MGSVELADLEATGFLIELGVLKVAGWWATFFEFVDGVNKGRSLMGVVSGVEFIFDLVARGGVSGQLNMGDW